MYLKKKARGNRLPSLNEFRSCKSSRIFLKWQSRWRCPQLFTVWNLHKKWQFGRTWNKHWFKKIGQVCKETKNGLLLLSYAFVSFCASCTCCDDLIHEKLKGWKHMHKNSEQQLISQLFSHFNALNLKKIIIIKQQDL